MKSSPWSAWSSTSLSTCGAAPPTPASWIPGPQPQDKAPRPSSARLLRGSGASTPTSLLTPRVVRYATFKDLIEEQFAEHGIGADPGGVFLKESDCEFKMFASGRRFCQGALITLNVRTARTHACARRTPRPSSQPLPQMRRRQDLASWFLSLLYPEEDLLVRCPSPPPRLALRRGAHARARAPQTIDVPMASDTMDTFVVAVCRRRKRKTVHEEMRDLKDYAGIIPLESLPNGFPKQLVRPRPVHRATALPCGALPQRASAGRAERLAGGHSGCLCPPRRGHAQREPRPRPRHPRHGPVAQG